MTQSNRICFLIDDDEDDREIFCLALESANESYTCATAKDGLDAIRKLDDPSFVPDYIFIDLNMPYMSGKECLAAIKQRAHLATVPAIVYTTSSYHKDAEDTQALGASHFLVKPPSIGTLTGLLAELLNGEKLPYVLNTATAR